LSEHLSGCDACADKFAEMQKTMALLDEWEAPEPSPYFDTRLMARVREERAKPQRSPWFSWFRLPIIAGGLALVMMMAGGISWFTSHQGTAPSTAQIVQRGTAVSDLQTLVKNEDLYANFDLLDDLQVQPDVDTDQETP
jgi:anti-sigma factor RsiW